jgi:holo-[acyl-carrier protein] synthase
MTAMLRVGTDLIEIERIEGAVHRWGERFLEKIFTAEELAAYGERISSLAARFAAKEAASKALGTGLMTEIPWTDIEVLTGPSGEPGLHLHGRARAEADRLGLTEWALSLSHSGGHALAVVVATGK